ncbi:MAG: TRAP transporter permease, partial [Clostridia bacterium]|nr:TRAP transporter permease [Clostridia bacterium]
MALFKKKTTPADAVPQSVEDVMKKYDRESNTRVWEGVPKILVQCTLALFSLFCIYVTLFATWLEEIRLTSFVACIVFLGYLIFPAKKGVQKVNHIPWYDVVLMVLSTASYLYYTVFAFDIIKQGAKFETWQILIGIVAIATLAEVCRRSVGLPILIVAGAFVVYALTVGLSNPTFMGRLNYTVRSLFYSKEGIFSAPIN